MRRRVLLLCSPCMGHLIPFTELSRRLVADHGLAATLLFAAATSPPSAQYLALAASAPDGVDLAALMVDMIGTPARQVAAELGVPSYVFFTSPWMTLSLFLHLPELDASRAGEHLLDATEPPICLPGYAPIHAHDLPRSMLADRSSESYTGLLAMAKEFRGVDGILVNTFRDLEPAVGDGLEGLEVPVHPVGPLVMTRPARVDQDHECLRWLDQQPHRSVVYVSFGSGGTLTWQQTAELALGLERSQHRFIWAVKKPHQDTASGSFFGTAQGEETSMDYLPKGFIERTSGIGLVIQAWAPQPLILAHASVRCFITHCGWNSALESILNAVPMIAWPLFAEQHMNASLLEIQVGVATRIKIGPHRFITKEEIASAIHRVMEGQEAERMMKRASELREKSLYDLSKVGCTTQALAQIADTWK